ncbi:hypothetical protein [Synechococcus sp. A15-24]|uniref:hypothetical protein n=1 Tax=Synechococcus sp. A15-24 TaxID=1050635 RepID=UPI00164466A6|nr:hypothetical protein [Synechococcus sp. A15-24]QNJ30304.1 hypothetical protein SynA1524_02641 [Synechococcus sp. A15-24]
MKRFSIVAALWAFGCPVLAQVDPQVAEQCKDARDFLGCVKAFSQPAKINDELSALRDAMKKVASRLASGTSLNNSSSTFQPVIDAHAIVPAEQQNSLAYQSASMAIDLFDLTQSVWQSRISNTVLAMGMGSVPGVTHLYHQCVSFKNQVGRSYGIIGKSIPWNFRETGMFGGGCNLSGNSPESPLYRYTIGILKEGATNPNDIKEYSMKLKEAKRLASLGPWNRYLEKNPGMKAWAMANPGLAESKKNEYIKKNGSDTVNMPDLPANFRYLRGTKVEAMISGTGF